jgi:hypothetical protein
LVLVKRRRQPLPALRCSASYLLRERPVIT